jgi:SNF family Na+-dependent transporter
MILLIRGLFLEGSSTGIAYLFKPDLSKIFDISVWVDAGKT